MFAQLFKGNVECDTDIYECVLMAGVLTTLRGKAIDVSARPRASSRFGPNDLVRSTMLVRKR